MKKLKYIAILCVALLAGSCTTIQKTAGTADIHTVVAQYPTVVDLEVSPKKASKTVSWSSISLNPMSLSQRKSNLNAELLQELEADVLVEPQYVLKKQTFGTNTLTVVGFPATYKNFRKATEADLEALRCGRRDIRCISEDFCPFPAPKECAKSAKKKGKLRHFLGL